MSQPHTPQLRATLRWALLLGSIGLGLVFAAVLWLSSGDAPPAADVVTDAPTCLGDDPHVVSLSPVGDVCFPQVPRRVVTLDAHYNDALVTFAQDDKLVATGFEGNLYDGFYDALPGVESRIDAEALPYVGPGLDKEALYALKADVHHIDPERLLRGGRWKREDIDEIARNVGPFFANRFSRTHGYKGAEPYTYYTAWELAERVGEVYRQGEKARRLAAAYARMVEQIQAKLPPVEERPSVGLIIYSRGRFTPYNLSQEGFGTAQYRAVGARDAFASIKDRTYADHGPGANLDLEGLLALDPDVLIMPFALYPSFQERLDALKALSTDPLARRLKAIREGRVYPGGSPLQGPIFLLFQTEMAAKQIYPERFGPFRPDHTYPKEQQLFDRAEVARILRGEGGRR